VDAGDAGGATALAVRFSGAGTGTGTGSGTGSGFAAGSGSETNSNSITSRAIRSRSTVPDVNSKIAACTAIEPMIVNRRTRDSTFVLTRLLAQVLPGARRESTFE
jgi:hypothetical protein